MMSLSDKQPKLDAWLADWPAPERDDGHWSRWTAALEQRLDAAPAGDADQDWLAAPMPAQPGEPEGPGDLREVRMSEPDVKRRRQSLKSIAERVSSVPPHAGATSTPPPADAPRPSFVSRPGEVRDRDSDSGVLDLAAIRKSAASIPDMQPEAPKQDSAEGAASDQGSEAKPAAASTPAHSAGKRSFVVPVAGAIVAVTAMAAALVFVARPAADAPSSEPAATQPALTAAPMVADEKAAEKTAKEAQQHVAAAPENEAPAATAAEGASRSAPGAAAPPAAAAAKKATSTAEPAGRGEAADSPKAESPPPAPAADKQRPRDLGSAIAGAVGAGETTSDKGSSEPTGPRVDPGSIPEKPSQGAIQGALGSVMGAARSCVAGMDAPSRATIVFGSDGSVKSVSVGAPAAGTPAESCIRSALSRARVPPFKSSSFTFGVNVRP